MLNDLLLKMELKKGGNDGPIGYSQERYIHDDDDVSTGGCGESLINLKSFTEELNSPDLDVSTSERLLKIFYTCAEALQNSRKLYLKFDLEKYMHILIAQARISSVVTHDSRISSHPPINKRRRTHKTFHMH